MSYTVDQLLKRSLKALVVAGNESEIEAVEAEDYIEILNALASEYESLDGVTMTGVSTTNWTAVTGVESTLTSPDGVYLSLAHVMAEKIAIEYGVPVDGDLAKKAYQGDSEILRQCTTRTGSYKPGTLPIGSGNEGDGNTFSNEHYYSGSE